MNSFPNAAIQITHKKHTFIFYPFGGQKSKMKVWSGLVSVGGSEGGTAHTPLPVPGGVQLSWACSPISLIPASLVTWPTPLCLCQMSLCLSLIRTLVTGSRAHSMSRTSSSKSLNLITSAKTLFPWSSHPQVPGCRCARRFFEDPHPALYTMQERGPGSEESGRRNWWGHTMLPEEFTQEEH